MSMPQPQFLSSVEEYLALERTTEERHEYLDGQIYAMAGESPEHGTICMNLSRIISTQLLGKPCQAFAKDMKVRSGPEPKLRQAPKGLYSYPDLVVVCGEMQFHDEYRDVLLNPTVIIEVLSPAMEAFDRGEKWARYQTWLPSLTDYLLVSQIKPMLEHYRRQTTGGWLYYSVHSLGEYLYLSSVDCTLRLAEVYDRIVFPVTPDELPDSE
jgi:Uma2 family endonuclease